MIVVRSLGCRTDLMLIAWDGTVDDVDGAVRARSPTNPGFWFGNFLLFPDAPRPGDAALWIDRFATAFADDPRINHICLRWDRPDGEAGELAELIAAGFEIETTIVLATAMPRPPPRSNPDVALRRIESPADWDATIALQIATMTELHGAPAADFARRQMTRYRRFVADGRGAWFGAFADGELVADMGVFVEAGLARFQAVETARAFRRRGVCGTLAYHAAQVALDELGAERLVMVGLPDHTAAIYQSIGFEPRERLIAAVRSAPQSTIIPLPRP